MAVLTNCPPVDLRDSPLCLVGLDVVPDPERLLEEHEQPGDDLTDGVLKRKTDHDRPDTQRGEQPADVGAPNVVARISPVPIAISPNLLTSRKMAGCDVANCLRGIGNTEARMPASRSMSTSTATTVPTKRTGMDATASEWP